MKRAFRVNQVFIVLLSTLAISCGLIAVSNTSNSTEQVLVSKKVISEKVLGALLALKQNLEPKGQELALPREMVLLISLELLNDRMQYTREERLNIALELAADLRYKSFQNILIRFIYSDRKLAYKGELSPLEFAQRQGYTTLTSQLARKDRVTLKPFFGAIKNKDVDLLIKLLNKSNTIDIDTLNKRRSSLLDLAIKGKQLEMIKELLKHGVDVNHQCCVGVTPLMLAAIFGDVQMAQMLLDAGADPVLRSKRGRNALINAKFYHNPEVEKILAPYFSKPDILQ